MGHAGGAGLSAGALNPDSRRRAIAAASSGELDLLVVGGGITGAGAALDAATRRLGVALVEARDLASGTSSASSKLIHGGLRYLEMGDFGLVRERCASAKPCSRAWRRTWCRRCRSCGRFAGAAGSARISAPAWRSTTRSAARARCPAIVISPIAAR